MILYSVKRNLYGLGSGRIAKYYAGALRFWRNVHLRPVAKGLAQEIAVAVGHRTSETNNIPVKIPGTHEQYP